MEHNDTFWNQFQQLDATTPEDSFPGKEKIWDRVETKLDHKVAVQEQWKWKKIAGAASVTLLISISYLIWNSAESPTPTSPQLPKKEAITNGVTVQPNANPSAVGQPSETPNHPSLQPNIETLVEKSVHAAPIAAAAEEKMEIQEEVQKETDVVIPKSRVSEEAITQPGPYNTASSTMRGALLPQRKFDAIGVQESPKLVLRGKSKNTAQKEEPLVVVDGEVTENYNLDDADSVVYLNNPLYIIDGIEYTEKEVFGPNPTCPYAPLKDQPIESVTVLQAEKAIEIYGKKAENGVVIITTKTGKPTPKK